MYSELESIVSDQVCLWTTVTSLRAFDWFEVHFELIW